MLNKNINGKIKWAPDFEDLTFTPTANTIFPLTSLVMHVCLYINGAISDRVLLVLLSLRMIIYP